MFVLLFLHKDYKLSLYIGFIKQVLSSKLRYINFSNVNKKQIKNRARQIIFSVKY